MKEPNMNKFLVDQVISRLKEKSTWVGLAGLVASMHFAWAGSAAEILPLIGTCAASVAAVLLRERK